MALRSDGNEANNQLALTLEYLAAFSKDLEQDLAASVTHSDDDGSPQSLQILNEYSTNDDKSFLQRNDPFSVVWILIVVILLVLCIGGFVWGSAVED